ncbi:hypothetical protein Tco_0145219 [Tanacetum coccineum]
MRCAEFESLKFLQLQLFRHLEDWESLSTKEITPQLSFNHLAIPQASNYEVLVNSSKRRAFWSLNEDILKITNLATNTPYPSRKIRRIRACTHQRPQRKQVQYAISRKGNTPSRRAGYGSGIARPKIEDKDNFELKGQFLKELCTNTFSYLDHEDANEHIEKVLEIVDLFHIPNITIDQVMLRAFPMSLTGAARTNQLMEEINNFQQEPDENLYQAWERFKELLMECSQHYLTYIHEVILFYNGLGISTRRILDSIAIQAQLNNLGREIKKVNEKVYDAQVGWEQCKGPHYTKDCPLKEEGKTLEEAYYMQFGRPFQGGGYRAAAPGFYQRNNVNPSYQEQRQSMEDILSKFMSESAKRHEEKSNLIKEIRALTDAAIQNQGA